MKQKTLNRRFVHLNSKKRVVVLLFMGVTSLFAIYGFIWSILPIEAQSSTIQLPDTYEPGTDLEKVQFPLKRDFSVSFPEYLRYGDVHEILVEIEPQQDPLKCDEFCIEKHLTYDNVWLYYQPKLLFSFDINNLQMEPKGETILPLAKSASQEFSWKLKADQYNTSYIKSTVYLVFDSTDQNKKFDQLIYAKELTLSVKKAGPFSYPVFRIITIVWVIVSILFGLVNVRYFRKDIKN